MRQPHPLRLSFWARLVALSLLLGFGLLAGGLLMSSTAHAQPLSSTTITNCSDDSQLQSAVSSAASGDTITFGCGGTIPLTKTLTIATNLTLDGNGHSVTLDGGHSVEVLSVNSGVNFTLKALTVAHGSTSGSGGGLFNNGTVTISNSTFADNSASASGYTTLVGGGGLVNNGGTVTISNSTFAGNSAPGLAGGGLYNYNGTVTISNSTFSGNSAKVYGGALYTVYGTINISNSTLSNNSAGGLGGGISLNGGTAAVVGSIVAENHAGDNQGNDCDTAGGAGTINDNGYNLDSDKSCFTAQTSLHTNPELSALANNGGPTQTLALGLESPAIDQIPAVSCPGTDQRGVTRPDDQETTCDIGAYESNYAADNNLDLTNMPSNITTHATSPQGAVVTYTLPTAVDGDSSAPVVKCTPASGSTFAIGTTTVTCTATDSDDTNSPVSKTFTVTVNDTDLSLTNLPANITTDATSSQGAVVTYTPPTVVDEDSPAPSVSCTPASGSTFAIGSTKVTCTATDSDDTNSPVSASFTVTVNDADLGLTNVPANITVNATSPQGAVVTYTPPTATDESGDSSPASVSCTPASGSTFAIGTTKVTCTATDSDDTPSSASQSFTVTVNDTDLGLANMPANITVDATSRQGATVTYTPPTVVDEDSPLPPVSCTPVSGSTFAIGTTTVTCTVSDSDDTPSSASQSFTVTIKGAAAQVSDLVTTVNSFHLSSSLQTTLDNKLQDVQTAIKAGQTATACSELTDFSGHVQSQSGKGLTTSQANQLIAAAKQVQAVLGC